jgi:hypothetical protein
VNEWRAPPGPAISLVVGRSGKLVEAPHTAIEGREPGEIVNLTDFRAAASRTAQVDLLQAIGPHGLICELRAPEPLAEPAQGLLPHLVIPDHQDVRADGVVMRRLHGALAAAAEHVPTE